MRRRAPRRKRSSSPEQSSARLRAQREELLHAAQRAIRQRGAGISMEDVAAEAGITRPILYRHFGDRRGMAQALRDSVVGAMLGIASVAEVDLRSSMEERIATLYPEARDVEGLIGMLSSWTTGFASFVDANRELYRFLRKEGVMDVKWEVPRGEWSEPIADNIGRSLAAIFADRGVDRATARAWGYALVGMVGGALEWWAVTHDRDRLEIERDLGRLTAAALHGLLAAAPRAGKGGRTREPAKKPARRPRALSR
jgi:AcrR family transcriptional regulator